VTEYTRQWVSIQPYRPSSRERRESQIRTHLEPSRLGQMRLVKVRHSDVQAFATDLDRRRAAETVRGVMRLVAAIFASAVRDQLIGRSPAQRIVLAPPPVEPVMPLTVQQVASLREAMPKRMQAMVLTQVGLGLRVGELLALRVAEVDFLRREVHIVEQLHPRTRERMPLKTPSSRRTLPLPQMVSESLAAHLAEFGSNDEDYMFTNARGLSYQAHTYQYRLRVQAQRAGLPPVTSHDLRHSYASWLLLARRVRGHRRRAARAQRREQGDLHLRSPRAGYRGPHPSSHRRRLECPRCALAGRKQQLTWPFTRPRRSGTPKAADRWQHCVGRRFSAGESGSGTDPGVPCVVSRSEIM
jgi:integrase